MRGTIALSQPLLPSASVQPPLAPPAPHPSHNLAVSLARSGGLAGPSPIFHCKNLSDEIGGAQIYLKREDLNHTGSHKINHCLGEALLAKSMVRWNYDCVSEDHTCLHSFS